MENLPEKIQNAIDTTKFDDISKIKIMVDNYTPFMSEISDQINILKKLKKGNVDDVDKAKRVKIDLGRICSRASIQKKSDKDSLLLETRFIDKLFNVVNDAARITQDKAKEIENYFEIQEQKRLKELQSDRVLKLSKYIEDAHERDLSCMEDDVWSAYLSTKKKEYEDKIAKEIKDEEERIASEEKAKKEIIKKEIESKKLI